jgi:hypothetical protein
MAERESRKRIKSREEETMRHFRFVHAALPCALILGGMCHAVLGDESASQTGNPPSQVASSPMTGDRNSDFQELLLEVDGEHRTEVWPYAFGHVPPDLAAEGMAMVTGKAVARPQFPSDMFPDGAMLMVAHISPLWNDMCRSSATGDLANGLGTGHVVSAGGSQGVAGVPTPGAAALMLLGVVCGSRRRR